MTLGAKPWTMITELGHKITLHAGPNFQPDLMMMNGNLMIIIDRTLFCAVSDLREAIAWCNLGFINSLQVFVVQCILM